MEKSILNKFKFLFIFAVFLFIGLSTRSKAASINISTSKSSVSPGESFTVTVSVNNGAGKVVSTVSNGSGGMTDFLDNNSYSFTCTAGNSGTVSISASGTIADYTTEQDEERAASATVSIVTQTTDNTGDTTSNPTTDNSSTPVVTAPTLSNLGITPYDFTGFKSGTTSYSVTVPNDCTSVSIYANSNNGTVTGTGSVTLKEGTNKFTVTVSNSSGSKSYTLSIIRKTEESETIPNVTDEETEDNSSGIGLTGLRVSGYSFEEEFNSDIYEYTVKLTEALTENDLLEIKNSITAITNTDEAFVEIETELKEDGSAIIRLIVKDDEKEYAIYTINFIFEAQEESDDENIISVAGTTKTNNSQGETTAQIITRKMLILLGCLIAVILIALYYVINSYIKSKKLSKYESNKYDEEFDDEDNNLISSIYAETNGKPLDYKKLTNMEDTDEKTDLKNRISNMLKDDSKIPEYSGANAEIKLENIETKTEDLKELSDQEIIDKKSNPINLAKETEEKLDNLNGYRKFRKGFNSGGKH